MSDLTPLADELRDAVRDVAGATVAPPFAGVVRRARTRHRRRVATVAASTAALLAAGLLALPHGDARTLRPATTPSPTLKPYVDFADDPAAHEVYDRCMAARPLPTPDSDGALHVMNDGWQGCLTQAGYAQPEPGPDGIVNGPGSEDASSARCWEPPAVDDAGAVVVGSGSVAGKRWWVVGWQGVRDTYCMEWVLDPPAESLDVDGDKDSGPEGKLRTFARYLSFTNKGVMPTLFWGVVPETTTRVRVTIGTKTYDVTPRVVTGLGTDRKYFTIVAPWEKPDRWHIDAYDAAGTPTRLPIVG
jgi:hypothetical protein